MSKYTPFISPIAPDQRTPSGTLSIADEDGNILEEDQVPGGLRLELYVRSLYPSMRFAYWIKQSANKFGKAKTLSVLVVDEKNRKIYRNYTIFYDGRQDPETKRLK